jgi:hypothetical protein
MSTRLVRFLLITLPDSSDSGHVTLPSASSDRELYRNLFEESDALTLGPAPEESSTRFDSFLLKDRSLERSSPAAEVQVGLL